MYAGRRVIPCLSIDGSQDIIKILADEKTAVAQNAAMQYG